MVSSFVACIAIGSIICVLCAGIVLNFCDWYIAGKEEKDGRG